MIKPVCYPDDVIIRSVDGISINVPGNRFDVLVWVSNLDTHCHMGLGIFLPYLVGPEIDKSLCIKDSILTLLGDSLCDCRIIKVEPREPECTIDTIDDHLCTKLEIVVDVCLYLTV